MVDILHQVLAFAVIASIFLAMQFRRNAPTDLLFVGGLIVFTVSGILTPEQTWKSFSHEAVIAIAGLLVISAALRSSGALDYVGRTLLGTVRTETRALGRLATVLVTGSAFLLNTALVAMMMPVVIAWCRTRQIAPSRLLLPVSYLTILGGTCTLVGTSTNFVVDGALRNLNSELSSVVMPDGGFDESRATGSAQSILDRYGRQWLQQHLATNLRPMGLLDISAVGVPCAFLGALLIVFFGRHLLPNRTEMLESLEEHRREYLVEMTVLPNCLLVGKTVEEGGLRHLPGLFLIEIDRDGEIIGPVSPMDKIHANDRLVFTGVVATIVDLEKIPGLVPAADINYEIAPEKAVNRSLVEVVLSPSSPLVGSTIREANFRQYYGAAVVAVHRNGERLPTKIGDIELSAGDTLLLQTQQSFVKNFRNRPDFYLVSHVDGSLSRRHNKLPIAAAFTGGMILWLFLVPVLASWVSIPEALVKHPEVPIVVCALGVVLFRCLSVAEARQAVDLPLLITVGAAIGVGKGLSASGAAQSVAQFIIGSVGHDPYHVLAVLFILTVVFTELLSNVAVAAMMFSIALGLASELDVNPRPLVMAVTLAASYSFVSPLGYQTNLMVMGPGGYRPSDFLRAGLPLSIVVTAVAILLIPRIWAF